MCKNELGEHAFGGEGNNSPTGVDRTYIVDEIDIENDGGDF